MHGSGNSYHLRLLSVPFHDYHVELLLEHFQIVSKQASLSQSIPFNWWNHSSGTWCRSDSWWKICLILASKKSNQKLVNQPLCHPSTWMNCFFARLTSLVREGFSHFRSLSLKIGSPIKTCYRMLGRPIMQQCGKDACRIRLLSPVSQLKSSWLPSLLASSCSGLSSSSIDPRYRSTTSFSRSLFFCEELAQHRTGDQ